MPWFLIVLFYVSILFDFLKRTVSFNGYAIRVIVFIVDLALICFVLILKIETMLHVEIIPVAFLFYFLGYCVKSAKMYGLDNKWLNQTWVFLGPLIVLVSYWNEPVAMYKNDYGNFPLFVLGALLGIIFVCKMAMCLQNNTLLKWYGENSIIVYVLHFSMIKALHLIGKIFFPTLAECNYLYPANWHYFVCMELLLIPTIWFCNRYIPFLFGKKHRRMIQ